MPDDPLPAEKVRTFPQTPGVYLMKDGHGTVIYVGKAKNLRSRAGSYFLKEAAENLRTAELVKQIRDIDFIPTETEVDALLKENRLIKDIRPKFNKDLKDGKSFPYLQIRVREEFPALVAVARRHRAEGLRLLLVSGDFGDQLPATRRFLEANGARDTSFYKDEPDMPFINGLHPASAV